MRATLTHAARPALARTVLRPALAHAGAVSRTSTGPIVLAAVLRSAHATLAPLAHAIAALAGAVVTHAPITARPFAVHAVPPIFAPVLAILAAIADVLPAVAHILPPIAEVLQSVRAAAVMLGVPTVLRTVAEILTAVSDVLVTVTDIFPTVEPIFRTVRLELSRARIPTVAEIFPMIPDVFTPVVAVFVAIADVLPPIAHIFLPVADIFQSVRPAAIVLRVPNVLPPIAEVLAMVAHIFTPVLDVFAVIPDVLATIPQIVAHPGVLLEELLHRRVLLQELRRVHMLAPARMLVEKFRRSLWMVLRKGGEVFGPVLGALGHQRFVPFGVVLLHLFQALLQPLPALSHDFLELLRVVLAQLLQPVAALLLESFFNLGEFFGVGFFEGLEALAQLGFVLLQRGFEGLGVLLLEGFQACDFIFAAVPHVFPAIGPVFGPVAHIFAPVLSRTAALSLWRFSKHRRRQGPCHDQGHHTCRRISVHGTPLLLSVLALHIRLDAIPCRRFTPSLQQIVAPPH